MDNDKDKNKKKNIEGKVNKVLKFSVKFPKNEKD